MKKILWFLLGCGFSTLSGAVGEPPLTTGLAHPVTQQIVKQQKNELEVVNAGNRAPLTEPLQVAGQPRKNKLYWAVVCPLLALLQLLVTRKALQELKRRYMAPVLFASQFVIIYAFFVGQNWLSQHRWFVDSAGLPPAPGEQPGASPFVTPLPTGNTQTLTANTPSQNAGALTIQVTCNPTQTPPSPVQQTAPEWLGNKWGYLILRPFIFGLSFVVLACGLYALFQESWTAGYIGLYCCFVLENWFSRRKCFTILEHPAAEVQWPATQWKYRLLARPLLVLGYAVSIALSLETIYKIMYGVETYLKDSSFNKTMELALGVAWTVGALVVTNFFCSWENELSKTEYFTKK